MRRETKIIICEDCGGTGETFTEVLIDHHRSEYKKEYKTCSACEGSGRMIEEIKRELTPYKTIIKTEAEND